VEPNVGHEWTVEDTSESCIILGGVLTELEADWINSWKKDEIVEQTHLSINIKDLLWLNKCRCAG